VTSRAALARVWHSVTILVIAFAIIAQLVLVIQGVGVLVDEIGNSAPLGVRLLRFFSYFTVQSNLLAAVIAASLIARPDRDGSVWRAVRLAALFGMTVTFVVYMTVLRPLLHLEGIERLADIGFHYVAPLLAVGGWLLFGPWPRIDNRCALRSLIWPVAYLVYVLALGALTGWYPYPFINAAMIGYPNAMINSLIIAVLLLGSTAVFHVIDWRLGARNTLA
jgi:hypothetical protein